MNNIELSQCSYNHANFTVMIISSFNSLNSLLIKDDELIGLVYLLIRRKLFICIKIQPHITRDVHFFIKQSKQKIPLLSFTICKFLHEISVQTWTIVHLDRSNIFKIKKNPVQIVKTISINSSTILSKRKRNS